MTRALLLLAAPALAVAQSSRNFRLEAASSLPTAPTAASDSFLLSGSLGNTFSQITTSTCLEVAAVIIPLQPPPNLEGPFVDLDDDDLADGWEVFFFGDTAPDASTDSDGDGESNASGQGAFSDTDPVRLARREGFYRVVLLRN